MRITPRDFAAIQFVDQMGAATLSQIERAVYSGVKYSGVLARRRMRMLADAELVKRTRDTIQTEYVYYTGKKPGIADHTLQVTEIYVRLLSLPGKIETWEREPCWGTLRPDAFCEFSRGPLHYLLAFEVERLTGNPFNQQKYEQYYASGEWRKKWPKFPRVVIVTDKKVKIETTNIMFIVLPSSLEGLKEIL